MENNAQPEACHDNPTIDAAHMHSPTLTSNQQSVVMMSRRSESMPTLVDPSEQIARNISTADPACNPSRKRCHTVTQLSADSVEQNSSCTDSQDQGENDHDPSTQHEDSTAVDTSQERQQPSLMTRQASAHLSLSLQEEAAPEDCFAAVTTTTTTTFESKACSPVDLDEEAKTQVFTALLLQEFLKHHQLKQTMQAFQQELQQQANDQGKDAFVKHAVLGMTLSGFQSSHVQDAVWFEMMERCRFALGKTISNAMKSPVLDSVFNQGSSSGKTMSLVEKLVVFCASSTARRELYETEMVHAHSPVSVLSSPMKKKLPAFSFKKAHCLIQNPTIRPSQRGSGGSATHPPAVSNSPCSPTKGRSDEMDHLVRKESTHAKRSKALLVKRTSQSPTKSHICPENMSAANQGGVGSGSPAKAIQDYSDEFVRRAKEEELIHNLKSLRVMDKELRSFRRLQLVSHPYRHWYKKYESDQLALQKKDEYANELLYEQYGFIKRQDCALCGFSFLLYNLPVRVSFRCIMDLYTKWNFEPPDKDNSRYKPPLCYDAVGICRMCSQIIFANVKEQEQLQRLHQLEEQQTSPPGSLTNPNTSMPLGSKFVMSSLGSIGRMPSSSRKRSKYRLHEEVKSLDPLMLPALDADDMDDYVLNSRRDDITEGERRPNTESASKAMVYTAQVDTSKFMSAKEWSVIHTDRSLIRNLMEESISKKPQKEQDSLHAE